VPRGVDQPFRCLTRWVGSAATKTVAGWLRCGEGSASEPSRGTAKDGVAKSNPAYAVTRSAIPTGLGRLPVSPASWRLSASLLAVASTPRGTRCFGRHHAQGDPPHTRSTTWREVHTGPRSGRVHEWIHPERGRSHESC
jgi:hypothetical protein